jgi:hypothetical protein
MTTTLNAAGKKIAAPAPAKARKGRGAKIAPTEGPYEKSLTQVNALSEYSSDDLKNFLKEEGLTQTGTKAVRIARLTGFSEEEVLDILTTAKAANAKVAKPPKEGTGAAAKAFLSEAKKAGKVEGAISKLTAPEAKVAKAVVEEQGKITLPTKAPKAGTRDWHIALIRAFNKCCPPSAIKGFSTLKSEAAKEKAESLGLCKNGVISDIGNKWLTEAASK